MGRDVTIVSTNEFSTKPTIRTIIDADNKFNVTGDIKFNLKPNKVFLFSAETEERLR